MQTNCRKCNRDLSIVPKDNYELTDRTVRKYNIKGRLCMNCLEKKLGRKIQSNDLKESLVNLLLNPYTTEILMRNYNGKRRR